MTWFPNPELEWERRDETVTLEPEEVERRLGRAPSSVRILGGGLANLNALIDGEAILRIYRRHPGERAKEAALLRRGWCAFRVPAILAEGNDWLLLEHVPHTRLESSAEHGAATGRAPSEIHAVRPEPNHGPVPPAWRRLTPILDLANLTSLLLRSTPESRRATDALRLIERTVAV